LASAWHIFTMLHFQANLLFPYVSTPSGATGRCTEETVHVWQQSSNVLDAGPKSQSCLPPRAGLCWVHVVSSTWNVLWPRNNKQRKTSKASQESD